MKTILLIIALLLAIILQISLFPFLAVYGAVPNLVLVLILCWVVSSDFKKIWGIIILAGLWLDLFSGLPFGLISLSLVTTAYLIDWFNRTIFSMVRYWVLASLIVLGSLLYNLLFGGLVIIMASLSQAIPWYSSASFVAALLKMTIETFYNLLLVTIFYGAKKIFYKKQKTGNY